MPSSCVQSQDLLKDIEKDARVRDSDNPLTVYNGHCSCAQQTISSQPALQDHRFGERDLKRLESTIPDIHHDSPFGMGEGEPMLKDEPRNSVADNKSVSHLSNLSNNLSDCIGGVDSGKVSISEDTPGDTRVSLCEDTTSCKDKYMDAHLHSSWEEMSLDHFSANSPETSEVGNTDDWVEVHMHEDAAGRKEEFRTCLRERSVEDLSGRYSEILVYEGDTDSDAGSEDVELLPHRYNAGNASNAHLYVNKLSLAAELLRTKESLPYDDQFKLVVSETQDSANGQEVVGEEQITKNHSIGSENGLVQCSSLGLDNPAFVEDETPIKKQLMVKGSGECVVKVAGEHLQELEIDEVDEEEELWRSTVKLNKGYRRFGGRPRENSPLLPLYASTILNCPCCVIL